MEGTVELRGLEDALRALQAAFPNDTKQQQRMVHGAMGGSARKSLLPIAKNLAKRGDSSGSLSEALGVRTQPARKRRGKAGGMEIVPVRHNKKAMALYVQHYYTQRGKAVPAGIFASGIRHGHLVEFGFTHRSGAHIPAYPYLWPAARSGSQEYRNLFAGELKKRIESAVRRAAKKRQAK